MSINSSTNAMVVNNVPVGIAYPFSAFSVLQYDITNDIEQWFSTSTTLDMTNAGMGLPLISQNLVTGVVINNPLLFLFRIFDQYIINCVAIGFNQAGGINSNVLATAGHANPVSPASFLDISPNIQAAQAKNIQGAKTYVADNVMPQIAAVNQYSKAIIAASAIAYGSALTQQNMASSFLISGQLAGEYLPVVYGIIMSLFIGFALVLLILLFLPIGLNYLKMFFELMLFLTVCPILMAY